MASDAITEGYLCEMPDGSHTVSRQSLALAVKCKPLRLADDNEEIVAYSYNGTADTDLSLNFRYLSLDPPWDPLQVCWGLTWK